MKQLLIVVASVLASIFLFAGFASAQAPTTVQVTLTEWKVDLSTDTIPAGVPVKFVITNKGKLAHEVVLERDGATDEPISFNGHEQEAEDIAPGTTRTVEWTLPEAGKYQFACHIVGHFEAGMKTSFVAVAAAPTATAAASATAAATATPAAAQLTPTPALVAPLPRTGDAGGQWIYPALLFALALVATGLIVRGRRI